MSDRIPADEGVIPPRGYVLVQDTDGNRFWVNPNTLKQGLPVTELTGEQIARITRFTLQLAEVFPIEIDEALDNFRRDHNPETEIRGWENLAAVYAVEKVMRPTARPAELKLLFRVMLQCSFGSTLENVLATMPEAKGLADLNRVVSRFAE